MLNPNTPPLGSVAKTWGWFLRLEQNGHARSVLACARAGDESSIHRHEKQDNIFVLVSGSMTVTVYDEHGRAERVRMLRPDEPCMRVPAGVKHRFHAVSDCVLYEIYVGVDGQVPQEADIVREAA